METIDPTSPSYGKTRQMLDQLFQSYDVDIEVKSMELVQLSKSNAVVKISQITKKVNSYSYYNNKTLSFFSFKKYLTLVAIK